MIRALRRALRQWKQEFLTFWGRFTTFYRLVLGIILAAIIVMGARRLVLDHRTQEVAKLEKGLAELSVSKVVPTHEGDDDILQAEMQTENLQKSLERERQAAKTAIEASHAGGRDSALEIIDTLGRLISKHGLVVRAAIPVACNDEFCLGRICQSYDIAGDFSGIYDFLRELETLEAPCQVRKLAVFVVKNEDGTPVMLSHDMPMVALTFHFESIYVE